MWDLGTIHSATGSGRRPAQLAGHRAKASRSPWKMPHQLIQLPASTKSSKKLIGEELINSAA